ncbi:hypothetical protein N0824_01453 [Microcystis sp. 0824]|nr:hypothetical protein N0824_01453 [Microcystis sp. 0824]
MTNQEGKTKEVQVISPEFGLYMLEKLEKTATPFYLSL